MMFGHAHELADQDMHRKELQQKRLKFLARLPLIENEAMKLGLTITARAINTAVRVSGWEATGDLIQAGKAERSRRP